MRILCERGPYRPAWKKVFDAAEHQCVIWDPKDKPAFDAFDESDPHLFIAAASPPSRAVSKILDARASRGTVSLDEPEARPAADSFLYDAATPRRELECDFCYVGAYRPDKERLLDSYVLPLAEQGTLKILGSGPWPTADFLGGADEHTVQSLYQSAGICLNVAAGGRTSDRVYNILMAGGLCLSKELIDNQVPSDIVIRATTPENYHRIAKNGITYHVDSSSNLRHELRVRGLRFIFDGNTYWHRCDDLLRRSGFNLEADRLMEIYRECYFPSTIV